MSLWGERLGRKREIRVCLAVGSATLMVESSSSGCIPLPPTAIALLSQKRFLACSCLPMRSRAAGIIIERGAWRAWGVVVIVSRLWIGTECVEGFAVNHGRDDEIDNIS